MSEPGPAPGGCWLDVHPSAAVVVVVEVTAGEPVAAPQAGRPAGGNTACCSLMLPWLQCGDNGVDVEPLEDKCTKLVIHVLPIAYHVKNTYKISLTQNKGCVS